MNETLQKFARKTILEGLAKLMPENRMMFALMYGMKNGKRTLEDARAMAIEDVVAEIPDGKLDWAMQQVENTLKKKSKESTGG